MQVLMTGATGELRGRSSLGVLRAGSGTGLERARFAAIAGSRAARQFHRGHMDGPFAHREIVAVYFRRTRRSSAIDPRTGWITARPSVARVDAQIAIARLTDSA